MVKKGKRNDQKLKKTAISLNRVTHEETTDTRYFQINYI